MTKVNIKGWRPGIKTISLMMLLRQGSQSARTLAEAKSLVDELLLGRSFVITFPVEEEAELFLNQATDFGAIGEVLGVEDTAGIPAPE